VVVTRARLEVATVEVCLKNFSNRPIGYIRLLEFNAHAAEQMEAAILDLAEQGVEGYVLDLRGNPGGCCWPVLISVACGCNTARLCAPWTAPVQTNPFPPTAQP
jgi:hypothetical protein